MDKRYQVFISSTYKDLLDERQEVIQALLELDCIPAGMELFPAADDDQWTLIKKVIDDCDYYIIIVGGRYGSISASGISYTEMEYDYAVSQGKPVIGFIHKDPGSIPSSKTEQSSDGRVKLEDFRKKVEQKMCKYWSSATELGSVVSRSLIHTIKTKPAIGWVRANLIPDKINTNEVLRMTRRIEELETQIKALELHNTQNNEPLAQGEDKIEVRFTSSKYSLNILPTINVQFTWNEIFQTISPLLLHDTSEQEIANVLTKVACLKQGLNESLRLTVHGEDFQIITIQLLALKLITQGKTLIDGDGDEIYRYRLSDTGKELMLRLNAIKRI